MIHTPNQYAMKLVDASYDAEQEAMVFDFRLTDAAKIYLLYDHFYPTNYLADELANLEKFLDLDYSLNTLIYSWQLEAGTLKSWLSEKTLAEVAKCDNAYEALLIIRDSEDSLRSKDVQRFVTEYLGSTLYASQLRWGVRTLCAFRDGGPDVSYLDPVELYGYVKEEVETEEFQKFLELATPLKGNSSVKSLTAHYSAKELAELYAKLSEACQPYWPDYIRWIDDMGFTWVVPMHGVEADG